VGSGRGRALDVEEQTILGERLRPVAAWWCRATVAVGLGRPDALPRLHRLGRRPAQVARGGLGIADPEEAVDIVGVDPAQRPVGGVDDDPSRSLGGRRLRDGRRRAGRHRSWGHHRQDGQRGQKKGAEPTNPVHGFLLAKRHMADSEPRPPKDDRIPRIRPTVGRGHCEHAPLSQGGQRANQTMATASMQARRR
jgi:hypothetical protein